MRRTLCLAGILALLSLTPSAHAATAKMKYAKKTFAVAAHGYRQGEVTCPSGTQIVGGGVTVSSKKLSILASAPGSIDYVRWAGAAANPTGGKQTMTVIADCVKVALLPIGISITEHSRTDSIPSGSGGASAEPCQTTGDIVVGGGFSAATTDPTFRIGYTGPADASLSPDGVPDNFWEVSFRNPTDAAVDVTNVAICMSANEVIFYRTTSFNGAPDTDTQVTVKCGPGSQVVAGGAVLGTLNTGTQLRFTKPTGLAARPPGTGWTMVFDVGTVTNVVKGTATCLKL